MLFSLPPLPPLRLTGSDPGFTAITCGKLLRRNRKECEQNGRRVLTRQIFETETRPTRGFLSLLLVSILINPGISNPHQPFKITWKLSNRQPHEVINKTSGIHPLNTQWPDLYFNLRRLFLRRVGLHTLPGWSIWGMHTPTFMEWGTFLGFSFAQTILEVIGKLVGAWKAITVQAGAV